MARLPFNPDHVRTPEPSAAADTTRGAMSVSQAAGLIKSVLSQGLPGRVRIVGEISNFSSRHHWFFSIKDAQASLRCVCFASAARRVRFNVEDGMQVVLTGRVDFYDAQGSVQLYVDAIEPVGQGALELRLRQLMEELRELGYFDEARKKPLPLVPRRVAVVTSRSAAALQDVIETAHRRWPGCRLLLYDVRVQGEAAAPQIASAISALSRDGARLGIDAIILTRGGGSIEDLWAFNDRAVADALHRCTLPVVAAIGHETDTTVAELVADLRCSTPTQAVMKLIPEQAALEQELRHWSDRLRQELTRQMRHARHRLEACSGRGFFRRPEDLLERAKREVDDAARQLARALPRRLSPMRQRLDHLESRLQAAGPRRLCEAEDALNRLEPRLRTAGPRYVQDCVLRLQALSKHLEAVSPVSVLQRGYSYTLGPGGQVLRHAADVQPGDRLVTVLADGRVSSRAEGAEAAEESGGVLGAGATPGAAAPAPRRRARRPRVTPEQETLF